MGKRSKRKAAKKKLARHARMFKHKARKPQQPRNYNDNHGNAISPVELVFPIVRKTESGDFEAVGTGFFVHPAGGFVTAKHCLFDGDEYDQNCYAIHSVGKGLRFLREIQYFAAHPKADIGMGMLKGQLLGTTTKEIVLKASFSIGKSEPEPGQDIMTLAYPRMKISKESFSIFPCDQYVGKIVSHNPDGTAWLKSECYQTSMEIKSGASGGPVLRGNKIIGVNSTSFETPMDTEPISFITPIRYLYDLVLKDSDGNVTTVKELMAQGNMPEAI